MEEKKKYKQGPQYDRPHNINLARPTEKYEWIKNYRKNIVLINQQHLF